MKTESKYRWLCDTCGTLCKWIHGWYCPKCGSVGPATKQSN